MQKDVVRNKPVLELKLKQELLRFLILKLLRQLQLYNQAFHGNGIGGSPVGKSERNEKGKSSRVWNQYGYLFNLVLRVCYQNVRRASL